MLSFGTVFIAARSDDVFKWGICYYKRIGRELSILHFSAMALEVFQMQRALVNTRLLYLASLVIR